ncbi:MAG: ABC transporter permease subunit [Clostridia bacterium]|nr:ABC transporter permease subunit [Clostridia bacterium]
MLAVFKREMHAYFTGVIGYVFLVLFLAVGGAVFCFSTLFQMSGSSTTWFTVMLFMCAIILPILTMKSFSEERKTKTEQLFMTAPVPIVSVVIGKFLAAYSMFAGALVFNSLYFLILIPYTQFKFALLLGQLVALLLVGMVFISIGLFVSSLTENQLSAAIGSMAIIAFFLAISLVNALIPANYWIRYVFNGLSVFTRFSAFSSGYFDVASVVYFLSMSAVFLYLTWRVYDRRRVG